MGVRPSEALGLAHGPTSSLSCRVVTTAAASVARTGSHVRARISGALARRWVRDGVVAIAYFALTALWFHELMINIGDSVLYGHNDASAGIRHYWGAEFQGVNPFTEDRDTLNGAPEGLAVASAVQIANFLIPATIWSLHYVVGFTAASNLYLLGGFVATALSFYILLERLGLHPFASFFAGYAVAFNPWMLVRAGAGHSGFMQAWIFPLVIALLLYQHRHRNIRSAVFVGAALALAFYDNSYYGLMAAVVVGVFWVVDFARQRSWHERLWSFTLVDVALVTSVVAFLPALLAWRSQQQTVAAGVSNETQHLQNLGATAESYILPSFRHPWLGGITRHFTPRSEFIWAENTLYLGWSLLLLGLVGAVFVLRRHPETFARPLTRFFLVGMTVLAPVAFLFSLKRETSVLGLDVPMPSYVVGEFTNFWRVFARFGLLVTFALAALAAFVLTLVIRRVRYGLAIASVAFGLLVFEYYSGIPPAFKLEQTPYSSWIEKQPPGIVANYPMPTDNPAALHLLAETYFQQIYNKKPEFMLFGSGYGGTREDGIRIVTRYVTDPNTPAMLKAEGVRYVLLHDDVYREAGEEPPPVPPGFRLVSRIPGNVRALVLDPSVQPANIEEMLEQNAVAIAATQGLETPTLSFDGFQNESKTIEGSGTVQLSWDDPRLRRVNLTVMATSEGTPRKLQLVDEEGKVAGEWEIGTQMTQVTFQPLKVDGTSASYVLRTEPSGRIDFDSIAAQPLADFSVSIRDY